MRTQEEPGVFSQEEPRGTRGGVRRNLEEPEGGTKRSQWDAPLGAMRNQEARRSRSAQHNSCNY